VLPPPARLSPPDPQLEPKYVLNMRFAKKHNVPKGRQSKQKKE